MFAINIDTELLSCYFYFNLESFSFVEGKIRDIPFRILPMPALFGVANHVVSVLSRVKMKGDIITSSTAIFLQVDMKSATRGPNVTIRSPECIATTAIIFHDNGWFCYYGCHTIYPIQWVEIISVFLWEHYLILLSLDKIFYPHLSPPPKQPNDHHSLTFQRKMWKYNKRGCV